VDGANHRVLTLPFLRVRRYLKRRYRTCSKVIARRTLAVPPCSIKRASMMTGGCLCGAVRYEANGDPTFSVLCYCRDCQRASGTGHVPVMGIPRVRVTITGNTGRYGVRGGSGEMAVRHFCTTCGSLLFGMAEDEEGDMSIYIGTLDDPSVFKPTAAIYTQCRLNWDRPIEGLKTFKGSPSAAT
jgi:hypothetical protein